MQCISFQAKNQRTRCDSS